MTSDEAKNIIINKQMTYNDFAKKFNISIDAAIEIFRKLDLKKCSAGQNCVSPDGIVQSRRNFNNCKNKRSGLTDQCIYCKKQSNQQYCYNNKEYCKQRSRQYYQDNKEYCKQSNQQYRYNNKEYFSQTMRQNYQDNKEERNQKSKEYKNSYAKFDIFNEQLNQFEEIRRDSNNLELLQVRCAYCGYWFIVTNLQVRARIAAINGKYTLGTENRFYCSDKCKQACPIYQQKEYLKNDSNRSHIGTSREVQAELRQLVFERDNWTCQRCNTHKDNLPANISLHCHHIEGIRHEPIESADMDMCITVCKDCHKEIHKIPGCTRQDMQCKIEDRID